MLRTTSKRCDTTVYPYSRRPIVGEHRMKSRYLQQGMYAAVFTVAAVQANAAVDFSNLVEQVSPAVVSVNVVKNDSG